MKVYIHQSKSALILVVNKYKENWAVLIWVRQYYVIVSFSSNDPCSKTVEPCAGRAGLQKPAGPTARFQPHNKNVGTGRLRIRVNANQVGVGYTFVDFVQVWADTLLGGLQVF